MTGDDSRLPAILAEASGFVYYVSVTGITGTASAAVDSIAAAMTRIRKQIDLPIVTGFGIRTPAQAAEAARLSNGAVVGSAVVASAAGQHYRRQPAGRCHRDQRR